MIVCTRLITTILLTVFLAACSSPAEAPAVEPVSTGLPAAEQGQPATLPTTTGPTKSIGTPVPGWEEIPIMPGAYDSELEDMVFLYSVDGPVADVEEYYQVKMAVNGWTLLNRQEMDENPSTVLDFQKGEQTLNVMLVALPDENATAVILSMLGP